MIFHQIEDVKFIYNRHGQTFLSILYFIGSLRFIYLDKGEQFQSLRIERPDDVSSETRLSFDLINPSLNVEKKNKKMEKKEKEKMQRKNETQQLLSYTAPVDLRSRLRVIYDALS